MLKNYVGQCCKIKCWSMSKKSWWINKNKYDKHKKKQLINHRKNCPVSTFFLHINELYLFYVGQLLKEDYS